MKTISKFEKLSPSAVQKRICFQIFYEYPTLPYEKEWRRVFQRLILLEDRWVRKKVEKYVDKVIHYGGYHGHINSVQITNGINSHSDMHIPKYSGGIFTKFLTLAD